MDPIIIRYGESLTLPIDTGDTTAQSATMYVGKAGQMYVMSKTISLSGGEGTFVFDSVDTEVPLDTYFYQINVTDVNGYIEKYPTPQPNCDDCESEFPQFIVCEALDATEVS